MINMSTVYSAHPAIAAEQLQRAELESAANGRNNTNSRRQNGKQGSTKSTPKKYMGRTCNGPNNTVKKVPDVRPMSVSETNDEGFSSKRKSNYTSPSCLSSTASAPRESNGDDSIDTRDNNTAHSISKQKTLPDRTNYASIDDDDIYDEEADDEIGVIFEKSKVLADHKSNTNSSLKVCEGSLAVISISSSSTLDETPHSVDETDHVLKRCRSVVENSSKRNKFQPQFCTRDYLESGAAAVVNEGCVLSGLSSVISSPSTSAVSSPLSTPTRLAPLQQLQHSHHHCCQKSSGFLSLNSQKQHFHHHQREQQKHYKVPPDYDGGSSSAGGGGGAAMNAGCKNKKQDTRFSPSPYRQLLPIALCILSFATVFATLIVYMDTTEIRHQQFRLNMSRDYELNGVAQDDPALVAFLRQIHMRKYQQHMLKNRDTLNAVSVPASPPALMANSAGAQNDIEQHLNYTTHGGLFGDGALAPAMANYVADLVGGKMNGGAVLQSLTGSVAHLITAPTLSETLNWMGVLVEPEPRWYFNLRKQNAQRPRMQVVHACVSPNPYPKEITIQNEDVRINSLHDEETSWFNSRVKCFPLYTIMLACDRVEYDLLSLGVQGHELDILQTLPFDKVKIDVISIHLAEDHEDVHAYVQSITKFLAGKSYKMLRKFGRNYFYQRLNSASRTRKKDILLLKTP